MDKREAILNAALELFAELGYHGTSVVMIAERAQVGAGTIYRYFEDKEVLVNSLYRHWKRELMGAIMRDLPTELPTRQLLHLVWARLSEFSKKHPSELKFLEFHHHAPYLDQKSRELNDLTKQQFYEFMERSRREQVVKDAPPQLLMAFVIGAFNGVEKAFAEGEIERTPELEAMAEEMSWEAIRR